MTGSPLPSDPLELTALEDRLLVAYRLVQHFDFLSATRVTDLYARHRALPTSLVADQRALIAAVMCLGRLSELVFPGGHSRMRCIPVSEPREDITYFRLALTHLDQWGAASCTALCE
jgi:hypothetical protein